MDWCASPHSPSLHIAQIVFIYCFRIPCTHLGLECTPVQLDLCVIRAFAMGKRFTKFSTTKRVRAWGMIQHSNASFHHLFTNLEVSDHLSEFSGKVSDSTIPLVGNCFVQFVHACARCPSCPLGGNMVILEKFSTEFAANFVFK